MKFKGSTLTWEIVVTFHRYSYLLISLYIFIEKTFLRKHLYFHAKPDIALKYYSRPTCLSSSSFFISRTPPIIIFNPLSLALSPFSLKRLSSSSLSCSSFSFLCSGVRYFSTLTYGDRKKHIFLIIPVKIICTQFS